MTVREYIKHLAIAVKEICDKYNIPNNIDLEKYRGDKNA